MSRVEATSADDKQIGFDYQHYYFLNELLNIKSGQVVGFEVLDDVHIERADGTRVFIQLKHTVQTNATGAATNLTTLDVDLWKSISNWCKVITDPAEAHATSVSDQRAFTDKTEFVLASNKSESTGNAFLVSLNAFKASHKTYSQFIDDIKSIKSTTKSADINGYIDDLLALDPVVSECFLNKLSLVLGCDDIIGKCKTSIAEKQIVDTKIDDVFNDVYSSLKQESFHSVKKGEKISISFEEFNKNYRRHFDKARSGELLFSNATPLMPDNITDQMFIRQLFDVKDTSKDDLEYLTNVTTYRLQYLNSLERFLQDGDITQGDVHALEGEATIHWQTVFREAHHEDNGGSDEAASGRSVLSELRKTSLSLAREALPVNIRHGGFYELSNRPVIGWLKDWKERYK